MITHNNKLLTTWNDFPLPHSARFRQLGPRITAHMDYAMRTPHPLEVDRPWVQSTSEFDSVKDVTICFIPRVQSSLSIFYIASSVTVQKWKASQAKPISSSENTTI